MDNVCVEKIVVKNCRNKDVFINVADKGSSDVLIVVHGFDSNKSGSSVRFLMDNLPFSIVSFDLPMHGESDEELLLSNCIDDLSVVDSYVRNRFNGSSISLFGSSFGSYVILNYLKVNSSLIYKNIFLKSSAVKMDKVFSSVLIEEDMNSFKDRGYTIKNRNKKMVIPYAFYEELCSNQISFSDFRDREIYLFHGVKDDTALFDDLGDFNYPNIHIKKLSADHTFDNSIFSSVVGEIHKVLK